MFYNEYIYFIFAICDCGKFVLFTISTFTICNQYENSLDLSFMYLYFFLSLFLSFSNSIFKTIYLSINRLFKFIKTSSTTEVKETTETEEVYKALLRHQNFISQPNNFCVFFCILHFSKQCFDVTHKIIFLSPLIHSFFCKFIIIFNIT